MSAFICGDPHISAIVGWWGTRGQKMNLRKRLPRREITALGQRLLDENYRSVNHRYNEEEPARTFQLIDTFVVSPVAPVQVIKACHCLDYQCCETEDWATTEARGLLQEVIHAACRALPGYLDAPWVITAHPALQAAAAGEAP